MERKLAFYDFSVSPYSYDFVQFLLCARAQGCTQVVFVPGTRMGTDAQGNAVEYQKCTIEEQERRMQNLLLPLCVNPIVCATREEAKELWHDGCFPPDYTVDEPTFSHLLAHVLCQKTIYPMKGVPSIVAEVREDLGPNPILIPMRECEYRTERNSNTEAWLKVAEWLIARGENVWFIPDTAKADTVYPVGKTYSKAATSILHRLAVNEVAKLVLGANSGNMVFAFYSSTPMLYFNALVEGRFECSKEFWERQFMNVGSQLPWFSKLQRIIWDGTDTFNNIIKALEKWYAVKEGKGQWDAAIAPKFPLYGVVPNKLRSQQVGIAMAHGFLVLKGVDAFHDGRLSLACFGPSLKDTWENLKHPIMAVSGAHDFLLSKGVIPDYYVACDPREEQAKFLENPHPGVHYLMASCMHPSVWEKLKGFHVTLWHLLNGPESEAGIRKHDPTGELLGGGSTVGLRAMSVAARLGFKKFDIYGMDCSYDDSGDRHAGTHPGKTQTRFPIQVAGNPKIFQTSPQMKESAEEFMELLASKPVVVNGEPIHARNDIDVRMFGFGLLQTLFDETQKRNKQSEVLTHA